MPLETATYLDTLVPANPTGDDPLAQADDHIRMIKAALKATFPTLNSPITATPAQLATGYLSNLNARVVPSGIITMFNGAANAIPAGWVLCNGANGTPNLLDRFVVGAGSRYGVGAQGGSTDTPLLAHSHYFEADTWGAGGHNHGLHDPGHTHDVYTDVSIGSSNMGSGALVTGVSRFGNTQGKANPLFGAGTGMWMDGVGDHAHHFNGNTNTVGAGNGVNANMPPYYALAFIMKT